MCVLLLFVAGGLAIWALGLQCDLDNQRDQTAQAQQQAEQAGKDVEALAGEVDQISQSVSDAGDQLSQAGADAEKNAQEALDGLGTKVESLKGQVEKAVEDSGRRRTTARPDGAGTDPGSATTARPYLVPPSDTPVSFSPGAGRCWRRVPEPALSAVPAQCCRQHPR